jgi:hypothetical protein
MEDWERQPCKEWQGARTPRGYGREHRGTYVHRRVWVEANGPIAPGLEVAHRCDNPPCYELTHLFLATHAENMADMKAKGRMRAWPGARRPLRKLGPGDIDAMLRWRVAGFTYREIAEVFGISCSHAHRVCSRHKA